MYKKITMLTSLDIKKLQSVFATKDDLERFVTKEEFLSVSDALMYELKAIRTELEVGSGRRSKNSSAIENHEVRISFVEESLVF